MRPWLESLGDRPSREQLNAAAEERGVCTLAGRPVRFVAPSARDRSYEMRVFESGRVATREDNLHDLFNALVWLAFPQTKARLNALHAADIPRESGRRGRRRDLLTLLDEGGVLVQCTDCSFVELIREMRWKDLFLQHRPTLARRMRLTVIGHAVLEMALAPWPGICCKALFIPWGSEADSAAAGWLAALPDEATPRDLPSLPVFGFPGWYPGNDERSFYEDARYFRETRDKAAPRRAAPPPDASRGPCA